MNPMQVKGRMEEMARLGAATPLPEAIGALAAVIDHLDMYSDTYEADVAALMGVGAALWELNVQSAARHAALGQPFLRT